MTTATSAGEIVSKFNGAIIRAERNRSEFYPMLQRHFDEGLARASFLVACGRTRDAAAYRALETTS
jgi:hypothetical protein